MSVRLTGVVKFFKDEKGFGFVTPDDGGKDVFIHRSELPKGVEQLKQNQKVSFVRISTGRGDKATEVTLV